MASRPPVRLNGVTMPPQMIAAEAQHHPAKTPAAAFESAARALIVRTLLLEEARRQDIAAAPELVADGKRETEDEAMIRALLDASVPVVEPSEEQCRAFYDANMVQFQSPDLFEASHILFASDAKDEDALDAAEAMARETLAELGKNPGAFETIARERSDCGSKSSGGRLGQIFRGETVSEFEMALDKLMVGAVAPAPVRTRFGVHVLRLDAREDGKVLPFEYVRESIEAYLAECDWRRAVASFIEALMSRASIEGIDIPSNGKHEARVP